MSGTSWHQLHPSITRWMRENTYEYRASPWPLATQTRHTTHCPPSPRRTVPQLLTRDQEQVHCSHHWPPSEVTSFLKNIIIEWRSSILKFLFRGSKLPPRSRQKQRRRQTSTSSSSAITSTKGMRWQSRRGKRITRSAHTVDAVNTSWEPGGGGLWAG